MDIIYHDVGGSHSVVVASALHLKKLDPDKLPTKEDLNKLSMFDRIQKEDYGHLIYQGDDEFGNSVYTVGCKYSSKISLKLLKDIYKLVGDENNLMLVDTRPTINILMKLGGFLSRGVGLRMIGRPIVTKGTLQAYFQIVQLVSNLKKKLQ